MPSQRVLKSSSLRPNDILTTLSSQGKAHLDSARTAESRSVVSQEKWMQRGKQREKAHQGRNCTQLVAGSHSSNLPADGHFSREKMGVFFLFFFFSFVFTGLSGIFTFFFFKTTHGCSDYCCLLFHYLEFIFAEHRFPCCSSLPHRLPLTHYRDRSQKDARYCGMGLRSRLSKELWGRGKSRNPVSYCSASPCLRLL